jgi:hypothetical protein
MNPVERAAYLKNQVLINLALNCAVNGAIAFFSYRERGSVALLEMAVDIQITVAIIAFLVSWIGIWAARQKMKVTPPAWAVLRSLGITLVLMAAFGGLVLTGPLALLSPGGLPGWGYLLFKTVYTGACAACAAVLAILSVFRESDLRGAR